MLRLWRTCGTTVRQRPRGPRNCWTRRVARSWSRVSRASSCRSVRRSSTQGIDEALRAIGEFSGVDRSYAFRIDAQGTSATRTSGVPPGIEPETREPPGAAGRCHALVQCPDAGEPRSSTCRGSASFRTRPRREDGVGTPGHPVPDLRSARVGGPGDRLPRDSTRCGVYARGPSVPWSCCVRSAASWSARGSPADAARAVGQPHAAGSGAGLSRHRPLDLGRRDESSDALGSRDAHLRPSSPTRSAAHSKKPCRCLHPDDVEPTRLATEHALREKVGYELNYRILRSNGETRLIQCQSDDHSTRRASRRASSA